jgi:hypothetical protein
LLLLELLELLLKLLGGLAIVLGTGLGIVVRHLASLLPVLGRGRLIVIRAAILIAEV